LENNNDYVLTKNSIVIEKGKTKAIKSRCLVKVVISRIN
jgi:hypothetical protein